MGSKLVAVRLNEEDQKIVEILRKRFALGGTSQTIRYALKVALDVRLKPRSIYDRPDFIDLNQEGVELVVEGPVTRPSSKPTAGLFPDEKIRISDE